LTVAAPVEFTFRYGSTTIPGTFSGCEVSLHGVHEVERTSRGFRVVFDIIFKNPAAIGGHSAAVTALEAALSQPDRQVVVTATDSGGSGTFLDLDPSNYESFNVEASLSKPGTDEADSARSSIRRVTIEGEVPWVIDSPGAGRTGLRELDWSVSWDDSRRQSLSLEGEYTAQAGTSAYAQYSSEIEALYTAISGTLTGNWPEPDQPVSERATVDRVNGTCSFSREYLEIIKSEDLTTVDNTVILDQKLTVTRSTEPEEGSPFVSGATSEGLSASYECAVDHTQRTDLLVLYESTIRQFIVSNVRAAAVSGKIKLDSEVVTVNPVGNKLSVEMRFTGRLVTDFKSLNVVVTTRANYGRIIAKTWPTDTGQQEADLSPTPAYVSFGPKEIQQEITTTFTRYGLFPAQALIGFGQIGPDAAIPQFQVPASAAEEFNNGFVRVVKISGESTHTQRTEGDKIAGDLIDLTDEVVTEVIEILAIPGDQL
jgi:hypothetical protein